MMRRVYLAFGAAQPHCDVGTRWSRERGRGTGCPLMEG
jgi:hypothetical protein